MLTLLFCVPLFFFAITALVERIPEGTLDTTVTGVAAFDACEDKCLIVYLAPRCPDCLTLRPSMTELANELIAEDISVTFVVGADTLENGKAYTQGLPGETHLDSDSSFSEHINIENPPAFIVRRKKRTLRTQVGSVPDRNLMRHLFDLPPKPQIPREKNTVI